MPTLVLTQNNNLAIQIQQIENHYVPETNAHSWIPREIAYLDNWIKSIAATLLKNETFQGWTLLTAEQELTIWRSLISDWQKNLLQNFSRPDFNELLSKDEQTQIESLNLEATTRTALAVWHRLRANELLETPYIPTLAGISLGKARWAKSLSSTNSKRPDDNKNALFFIEQLNGRVDNSYDARKSREFNNYVAWQSAFQNLCSEKKWLDQAVLPTLLSTAIDLGSLTHQKIAQLPETDIIAYAFWGVPDSYNPQEIKYQPGFAPQVITLFRSLQRRAKSLSFIADAAKLFPQQYDQAQCVFSCHITPNSATLDENGHLQENGGLPASIYDTTDHEFHDIARQIAAKLKDKSFNDRPSIGVIVPQLETYREQIIDTFDKVLCPRRILPAHSQDERPYTISLGRRLDQEPMVRHLLNLFELLGGEQKSRLVTSIITSPYFCRPTDAARAQNAALDYELRQSGKLFISFPSLLQKVLQTDSAELDDEFANFCAGIKRVAARLEREDISIAKTYAAWSDFWSTIIQDMQWPKAWQQQIMDQDGQKVLTYTMPSADITIKRAFFQVLDSMKKMSAVTKDSISYNDALVLLKDMTAAKISQPQATYKAPIHISGILEAVGLRFDYIYIINYTDQVWPSLSSPLPFLPMSVQRALNMPSPQNELEQARWVNERLSHLASQGTISFANTEVYGKNPRELNICRLLSAADSRLDCRFDTSYEPPAHMSWCDTIVKESFSAKEYSHSNLTYNKYLEAYDNAAPPPSPLLGNQNAMRGGSAILQRQLDCPFRALASYRWGIDTDEKAGDSPTYLTKGTLVHNIMERLWKEWRTYREFQRVKDSNTLSHDIATAVDEELKRQRDLRPDFGTTYYELERERLKRAFETWFAKTEPKYQQTVIASIKALNDSTPAINDSANEVNDCANTDNLVVICESKREVELPFAKRDDGQHFKLSLRLDRLDKTLDGTERCFLSDYKTSKHYDLAKWKADDDSPPCDVQLPLYAVSIVEEDQSKRSLLGMGYNNFVMSKHSTAHDLNSLHLGLKKVELMSSEGDHQPSTATGKKSTDKISKKKDDIFLEDMLPVWKVWIDRAANEIIAAHHPVLPRRNKEKDACQYCNFISLCHRDEEPLTVAQDSALDANATTDN